MAIENSCLVTCYVRRGTREACGASMHTIQEDLTKENQRSKMRIQEDGVHYSVLMKPKDGVSLPTGSIAYVLYNL